jgi:hypothetical protein
LFSFGSVNQTLPSGPAVIPTGIPTAPARGPSAAGGIGNSLIAGAHPGTFGTGPASPERPLLEPEVEAPDELPVLLVNPVPDVPTAVLPDIAE